MVVPLLRIAHLLCLPCCILQTEQDPGASALARELLEDAANLELQDDEFTKMASTLFASIQTKKKLTKADIDGLSDGTTKYVATIKTLIHRAKAEKKVGAQTRRCMTALTNTRSARQRLSTDARQFWTYPANHSQLSTHTTPLFACYPCLHWHRKLIIYCMPTAGGRTTKEVEVDFPHRRSHCFADRCVLVLQTANITRRRSCGCRFQDGFRKHDG